MKKFIMIVSALLFATSCFASFDATLQNKIKFNEMLNTYPELRDANIRFVPMFSEPLIVCEGGNKDDCSDRIAAYDTKTQTISIMKNLNPFLFQHAVIHEYCHHINFTKIDSSQWKNWTRLFNEHPNHVSRYSRTNAVESFAEWCATYKYGTMDTGTYEGVESIVDSPQAKFMDKVFPRYRKPL